MKIELSKREVVGIREGTLEGEEIVILIKNKINNKLKNLEDMTVRAFKKRQNRESYRKKQLGELIEKAETYRIELIKNQTNAEKIFKAILKSLNIKYDFQRIILTPKSFYIVDFYLPKQNIVFEIDGGYHFDPEQKKKDGNRTRILKVNLITHLYRFTNDEVKNTIETSNRVKDLVNNNNIN